MPQLAVALPPSEIVYRQLLNMRSALRSQGHDLVMADHVMRAEITRFLAEQAMESANGPAAERALAIAAFDGHLASRGRAAPSPEAGIRKFEHDIGLACADRMADAEVMGVWRGVAIALLASAAFEIVSGFLIAWALGWL